MNKFSNCIVCKAKLKGRQTKYCSISCKTKILQSYPAQKKRGLLRKLEVLDSLGGKCSVCGYSKNVAALTFHHVKQKGFKLDMRSISNRTLKAIQTEAQRCTLLCQNCHAEIHNPSLNLDSMSIKPAALTAELRAHRKIIKELK